MVPTPEHVEGSLYEFIFRRDDQNRSHIGYVLWDAERPLEVVDFPEEPILAPGALGCFDDNGVTPSCVVREGNEIRLYYIGWNPGSTVRMNIFGGLAISLDGGKSFQRWSEAPILERCRTDPYLNTAPWAVKAGSEWRLYYVSGLKWVTKDLPQYNIKTPPLMARTGAMDKCLDFRDEDEIALARPYVIFDEGILKMWFAHKGDTYRIGYAESEDGLNWERLDEAVGIDISKSGFDLEMLEYAAVLGPMGSNLCSTTAITMEAKELDLQRRADDE